jgi:hypothetical protein
MKKSVITSIDSVTNSFLRVHLRGKLCVTPVDGFKELNATRMNVATPGACDSWKTWLRTFVLLCAA